MMTKISIIIPVYNCERYVQRCLQSVITQTLNDLEVICIDDGSTDRSLVILEEFAEQDDRLSIIKYSENKSANQARKDGVLQSSGEYIMFVDADDYLELNACAELYDHIREYDVDILHFGTNIHNAAGISNHRIEQLEPFVLPCLESIKGEEVFNACFVEGKYKFTLWNKIYSAEICKKGFQHVKDGFYLKAEDLYSFLVISYFAQSYRGIPNKYYNYSFGTGVTGTDDISLEQFEKICLQSEVVSLIEQFFKQQHVFKKYKSVYESLHDGLAKECIHKWLNYLNHEDSSKGYDVLVKHWGPENIVAGLARSFVNQKDEIAKKAVGVHSLTPKKTKTKTIGVYYHRISIGGVQRVISLLMPVWLSLGYEVIFFTDEPPQDDDYPVPDSVKRIVIPSCFEVAQEGFLNRIDYWGEALREYQVDVMLYNAASSNALLFDMLYIKSLGIPFVLSVHELFSHAMANASTAITQRQSIYRIADSLVVLSNTEREYWRMLGISTKYIPNPFSFDLSSTACSPLKTKNILWVGRFDNGKQYLDVIKIFAEVKSRVPDAKLQMIGKDILPNATQKIYKLAQKLDVIDSVSLPGAQMDMDEFYQNAAVYIVTSISESFSMTIGESKAYGIPCVLYEMPYLEILQDGEGYLSVEQGDIHAAAKEIAHLLEDDQYRKSTGRKARQSIERFSDNNDIAILWKSVIDSADSPDLTAHDTENQDLSFKVLNAMMFHHSKGIELLRKNNLAALKKKQQEISKMKRSLERTRNSKAFKIGRLVTFFPRKVFRRHQ